jgi:hypothetical protein
MRILDNCWITEDHLDNKRSHSHLRCEIENTTFQTRVTDACIGGMLENSWINFIQSIALKFEIGRVCRYFWVCELANVG